MDDRIVDLGFLWFFGAALVGPLVGWALHSRLGFERSVGIACAIIGLTACVAGVWGGVDRGQQLAGMVAAEGRLVDFVEEYSKDDKGRTEVTRSPRVAFTADDGSDWLVKGFSGSQSDRAPGEVVPVRYKPHEPGQAVIADFQNVWGPILALAIFGIMPLLFGIFFLFFAVDRRKLPDEAGRRSFSAGEMRRERLAGRFVLAGNLGVLSAFALMVFSPYGVLPTLGAGFATISLSCVLYMLGELLRPRRVWERFGILFIVAAGFGLFGIGGLLLGLGV
jgi:hypothetical protein